MESTPTDCSVCAERPYCKGLCRKHYAREWRRERGSQPRRPRQDDARCERCPQPLHAKGLCKKHYDTQHRRAKGMAPQVRYASDAQCRLCPEPVHAKGLCKKHYGRTRSAHGQIDWADPFVHCYCGNSVPRKRALQKFCSDKCQRRDIERRRAVRIGRDKARDARWFDRTCPICAAEFSTRRPNKQTCSDECNDALNRQSGGVLCAGGCGRWLHRSPKSPPVPGKSKCRPCRRQAPCKESDCSQPVVRGRRVCKEHRRPEVARRMADRRKRMKQLGIHEHNRGGYKRRARHHDVPYEPIDARKVFARDGWICGICNKPVDKHKKYPDPKSASLDHVIPLSADGSPGHVLDNVQCSHLDCNVAKGARLGVGVQPALL